jgi:flagellar biosynthetic protein FliR
MIEQLLPQAYGFVLLLLRTTAMVASMPVLAEQSVLPAIRIAFAGAITMPIFLGAGMPAVPPPGSVGVLMGAALAETAIGLAAGLACQVTAAAAQAAGGIASTTMGLSFGAQVDPNSGAQSTSVAEIFGALGLAALLACGFPREAILWLCRQAIEHPPGATPDLQALAATVVTHAVAAASLGYRLAFPFLATVNVGHLALGILGRATPQINLTSLGFSITILIGGFMLYLAAPQAAEYATSATVQILTGS